MFHVLDLLLSGLFEHGFEDIFEQGHRDGKHERLILQLEAKQMHCVGTRGCMTKEMSYVTQVWDMLYLLFCCICLLYTHTTLIVSTSYLLKYALQILAPCCNPNAVLYISLFTREALALSNNDKNTAVCTAALGNVWLGRSGASGFED
eukprot:g75339.t1